MCVCVLIPRVYSTLYLCYSIHYTEIMWADAIRIHMKTKPIQGWGRRLLSEEITPSLTSDLTIFIWLFPYMNSATPKMKWELRRKSVHVCVCVGQIIYNPGSTGKTLLCLKHIYFIYIKYLYVHIFTQDLLKQILNYFPNLLTCERKGLLNFPEKAKTLWLTVNMIIFFTASKKMGRVSSSSYYHWIFKLEKIMCSFLNLTLSSAELYIL